jgi:hypothetical protein
LETYARGLIENAKVKLLGINEYRMPTYSADREGESGIPQLAHAFAVQTGITNPTSRSAVKADPVVKVTFTPVDIGRVISCIVAATGIPTAKTHTRVIAAT